MPLSDSVQEEMNPGFLVVLHGQIRLLLPKSMLSTSFDQAIKILTCHFPQILPHRMRLTTDSPVECEGRHVTLSAVSWVDILPELTSIRVSDVGSVAQTSLCPYDSRCLSDDEEEEDDILQKDEDDTRGRSVLEVSSGSDIQVSFRDAYGGVLAFKAQPDQLISTHLAAYASEFVKDQSILSVFYQGRVLDVDASFDDNMVKRLAVFYVVDDVVSPPPVVRFTANSSEGLSDRSHPFKNSFDGRKYRFLTIKSIDKRILLPRSMLGTYEEAIDAIATHFPKLKKETLLLKTNAFPECEGEYVEIPPTTWTHALPELTSVDIEIETKSDAIKQYPIIQILIPSGRQLEMNVQRDVAQTWMFPIAIKKRQMQVAPKCAPRYYHYRTKWCAQVGVQKNVLPTTPDNRSGEWDFGSRSGVPGWLDDYHAVVLPRGSVASYLNRVLRTVGLGAEERAYFISDNLHHLVAKSHVALVFVPQPLYDGLAPLKIQPTPDVVTRILMLFKCVPATHIGQWRNAVKRAEESVQRWVDIIGLDVRRNDETLCRVWQWESLWYPSDKC
ncbi:hypothetical protein IW262DRAFT_678 [Armillaria fumosa]|nr:hypothetical protein IW262DRAFT_678 [Armillaria fumosa]